MSHFYTSDGFLVDKIEYKDPKRKGQYRDTTLADARPLGLLPSVSTILSLLAKPGLVKWQVEQGIKAAWEVGTWAKVNELLAPETISIIYSQSQEYTRYTQDFGSAVHWWVNKKLRAVETNEIPPMIAGSEEVADGVLIWLSEHSYDLALTEHRFARTDLGWAGTIDMLGTRMGVPCIIDLKTQEPPLTPYLEHALQLAGYDYALPSTELCNCGHESVEHMLAGSAPCGDKNCLCRDYTPIPRERISLIANRLNPGEVKEHIWQNNDKYDKMFLLLRDFWFLSNNYDPRQELEDDQATTLEYLLEELVSD